MVQGGSWIAMTVVVGVGLLFSAAAATIAVVRRRERPIHPIPWWIAVIVLAIDTAIHAFIGIASTVQAPLEGAWLLMAALAIGGMLATAILRPRLGGIALLATAVLMPAALVAVDALFPDEAQTLVPLPVMLVAYSTRAVVVGLLLMWAGTGGGRTAVRGLGGAPGDVADSAGAV